MLYLYFFPWICFEIKYDDDDDDDDDDDTLTMTISKILHT